MEYFADFLISCNWYGDTAINSHTDTYIVTSIVKQQMFLNPAVASKSWCGEKFYKFSLNSMYCFYTAIIKCTNGTK
jgi:hypothetical protein